MLNLAPASLAPPSRKIRYIRRSKQLQRLAEKPKRFCTHRRILEEAVDDLDVVAVRSAKNLSYAAHPAWHQASRFSHL